MTIESPASESVTVGLDSELAHKSDASVTALAAERKRLKTADRVRRHREKARAARDPIIYEVPDWQRYLSVSTLPSKAGVPARLLRRVALKELIDNALDADPKATLDKHGDTYVIRDGGPGLDPDDVLRKFAVDRPVHTTKLIRKPTRGALGNGLRVVMGAVAASDGELIVTSRGVRQKIGVDRDTGETVVIERTSVPDQDGTTVALMFGPLLPADADADSWAQIAIKMARTGSAFTGPSSPHWYDADALHRLFRAAPDGVTISRIVADLGVRREDEREARTLSLDAAKALLGALKGTAAPTPDSLPHLGRGAPEGHHAIEKVVVKIDGVSVPCVIEAWATCEKASKAESEVELTICVNGTPVPAEVATWFQKTELAVRGCGVRHLVGDVSPGTYDVTVNITAPYVPVTTEGKEPDLLPFLDPLGCAIVCACKKAKRALGADSGMSIKEAAYDVMEEAYLKASGDGTLPAHARQIMYAARPLILELTGGKIWKHDTYFTQTLLPDYMAEHPDETAGWDVVSDARGALTEPHTGREVRLGTIEVREYLGERAELGKPAIPIEVRYPTAGPEHRYKVVLFVEKEGFDPLLRAAQVAERFDLAIMTTKGMSVVAARGLLDKLVGRGVEKVLVAHDFDVSGFSIKGTLTSDSRRYEFENKMIPVIDIGLRLADVQEMALETEPVGEDKGSASSKDTLRRHGATEAEIAFLKDKRVELNAMTSDQFIAWLERKLNEHGVTKLIPDVAVLTDAARRSYRQRLAANLLAQHEADLDRQAQKMVPPADLDGQVEAALENDPSLSWDECQTSWVRRHGGEGEDDVEA